MQDQANATAVAKRVPWNKGKLTGAKPPLWPRGCDIVAVRVEYVAARGYTADRATVRQKNRAACQI
jgi:hypothetical protein